VNNEFIFKKVVSGEEPLLDVIFVHGLTGSSNDTWSSAGDNSFWPEWLQDELKHLSIFVLDYPASMFEKWAKKEMDMFERAINILEHFVVNQIGTHPIVFVTHSLGGILTKILIRKSNEAEQEDYKKISEVTRLVIFLSTPHNGSSLANALKFFPGTSKHIDLLANETGFLADLNGHYRIFANSRENLSTIVYYEKHATMDVAIVVTRDSADPGVAGVVPIPVDKNHINICKPHDKDDIVYLSIKRHIVKLLGSIKMDAPNNNNHSLGTNYVNRHEGDRRDLLQKLIDAGREHEYGYANDSQNKFARDFVKTGLFTTAREDHESLLSEVETRFITHVYHPLICKGAKEEDIRAALQAHVVDSLVAKQLGKTTFSSKAILNALYFLTEQCHIRWDPEV